MGSSSSFVRAAPSDRPGGPARSPAGLSAGRRAARRWLQAYLLLLPAFAFLGVFTFWPVLYSLYLSTMKWKLGYARRDYVAFDNYARLFASPEFWNAAGNTVVYTAVMAGASIVMGLALSLALSGAGRLRSFWQTLFFLPVAATMAAMAVVWRFIFDTNFGVLNAFLARLGAAPVDWLKGDVTAMGAVILVGVWSNAGYAMVFFAAGLANIPQALYEAAEIDGAGARRRFASITWPLLSPTTLFVLIIMTVRALASFDIVKVLTDGGPLGATQVLSHLLFQQAFQFFNTGYASGIAVVFFVLVLALALVQMGVERWVHYL
jgi:ABC-type sugar transport system permease subunit